MTTPNNEIGQNIIHTSHYITIRWNDGRIIHAHLNERPYQEYRTKVLNLIKQCETRYV